MNDGDIHVFRLIFCCRNESPVPLSYSLSITFSAVPGIAWAGPAPAKQLCVPRQQKSAACLAGWWQSGRLTCGPETLCSRDHHEQEVSTHRLANRWGSVTVTGLFLLSGLLGWFSAFPSEGGQPGAASGSQWEDPGWEIISAGETSVSFYQSLLIWEHACLFFPQLSVERQKFMFFVLKVTE